MLLALDQGNTELTAGAFQGDTLASTWRLTGTKDRSPDEVGLMLSRLIERRGVDPAHLEAVAVCSVTSQGTRFLDDVCTRYFAQDPFVISHNLNLGITIAPTPPEAVGLDRLMNAAAHWSRSARAAVIVDCGTATTIDAVSADGEFLGGAILPGYGVAAEALFSRAPRLADPGADPPQWAIGRTTNEALLSGLRFGFAGQIDTVVERIRTEMNADPVVIATGGHADKLRELSNTVQQFDRALTLYGINHVWRTNRVVK